MPSEIVKKSNSRSSLKTSKRPVTEDQARSARSDVQDGTQVIEQASLPGSKADHRLETDPKRFVIRGFAVLAVTFCGFGGWAMTAPLDSAVIAPGIVIVDGGRHKIQHPAGGVIRDMRVRDGDRVEPGQVLLSLDPTQATASQGIVRADYLDAQADRDRLLSELKGRAEISFDDSLLQQVDQPFIRDTLEVQKALFAGRVSLRQQQIDILESQIDQSRREIDALEAQRAAQSRELDLLGEQLARSQQLLTEGLTIRDNVLELQRNIERIKGEALSIDATVAKTENRIHELRGEIALNKTTYQDQLHDELKQAQLKLVQSGQELISAEDVLRRIDLRSPVGGLVVNNNVVTKEGVVDAGQVIMEIVPDRDALLIDARVSINDVEAVEIGQKVNILLPAFDRATTPTLIGNVDHLAADRQTDTITGQPYFQARVSVPESEIARLAADQRLQPGMPADAVIVTGERTVLEYLLRPITLSFARTWREE